MFLVTDIPLGNSVVEEVGKLPWCPVPHPLDQ